MTKDAWMFVSAEAFDQDLELNGRAVTDMSEMFGLAVSFLLHQDLGAGALWW